MQRALVFTLFLSMPTLARGQVAVFPVQYTNIEPGQAEAVGALLADAYARESERAVLGPDRTRRIAEVASSLTQAAATLGAEQYVETRLVRLDYNISVKASLYSTDGTEIHRASLTAGGIDDLEPVIDRIAKALVQQVSTDETRELDNVVSKEATTQRRTFSEKIIGLKTDLVLAVAKGRQFDPAMSLHLNARFEGESYFLEFGAGIMLPTGTRKGSGVTSFGGLVSEFGASWYFVNAEVSPYIGGGVIPRILFLKQEAGVRLAAYGQIGAMFFRSSSTRLFTDLRVAQNVLPYTVFNNRLATEEKYFPTELIFEVGIGI